MSHPIALGSQTQAAAGLLAWSFEPAVTIPVAVAAIVYGRGWVRIHRRLPERFGARRPAAFAAGLGAIVLALCSPLDAAGTHLLRAHMVQHMLLMLVAPPLLWAGAPLAPLLLGPPRPCDASSPSSPIQRQAGWPSRRPSGSGTCPPSTSWPSPRTRGTTSSTSASSSPPCSSGAPSSSRGRRDRRGRGGR